MNPLRFLRVVNPDRTLPRQHPPRLLAVQIAGIGDLVLATPALSALRDRYPDGRIDVVTSPRAVDLLRGHPAVNRIIGFDIERFRDPLSLKQPGTLRSLHRQILPIRQNRYDALLSLNNISTQRGAWTLALLFKSLGIPMWVGRDTDERAPYFDRAVKDISRVPVPEAITKLRVAGLLGASIEPRPLSLGLNDLDAAGAKERLNGEGRFAALQPGANVATKMWPAERFAEAGRYLQERGFRVVLLGGPGDVETAGQVAKGLEGEPINLCGELSLRETAAMLQQMDLVVTNDTGPMHIAAAVGAPLVAVYGPSNSKRYRPWAPKDRYRLLHHRLTCNPCDYKTCPMDTWCMDLIRVEDVIEQIDSLLETGDE